MGWELCSASHPPPPVQPRVAKLHRLEFFFSPVHRSLSLPASNAKARAADRLVCNGMAEAVLSPVVGGNLRGQPNPPRTPASCAIMHMVTLLVRKGCLL